jgi:predicted CoA-binding protein
VGAYLQRAGYEIVPVRPGVAEVLGMPAHATVAAGIAVVQDHCLKVAHLTWGP